MAQPVIYQTMSNVGIDPTLYYTNTASVTPESPAPPFLVGQQAIGSDGSAFIFVQASTSISLTDFIAINAGVAANPYQANSLSNTTVASSILVGIAATGLIVKGSVTYIPAGAYFWAQTRGNFIPATTSGGCASANPSPILYTSATAGQVQSSISTTLCSALQGIVVVNSLTVSIPTSLAPPLGTLTSTGYTQGPVVALNLPRTLVIFSSTQGTGGGGGIQVGAG